LAAENNEPPLTSKEQFSDEATETGEQSLQTASQQCGVVLSAPVADKLFFSRAFEATVKRYAVVVGC